MSRILLTVGTAAAGLGLTAAAVLMMFRDDPNPLVNLALVGGAALLVICRVDRTNRPADTAYEDGYEDGYDRGWREGRAAAVPRVVRMGERGRTG